MPPSVKPIETEKLLSKTRAFLQVYRLAIDDGALEGYTSVLASLTEEEVTTAMDVANRENKTNFAPSPGCIYDLAMEIRAGGEFVPEEGGCTLCDDTHFRRVQVSGPGPGPYFAAVPCDCMNAMAVGKLKKFLKRFDPRHVSRASS